MTIKIGQLVVTGLLGLSFVGGTCAAERPKHSMEVGVKLSRDLMPQEGRTADFDFDGDEPESKVRTEVEISGVHMSMEDGALDFDGVYHGGWEKDVVFNGLNLDGFTLAMSFFPRDMKKCPTLLYKYQMVGINMGGWRSNDLRFSFANVGVDTPGAVVVSNQWNYFVVSLDAVKKTVSFVINGRYHAPRALPANFAWPVAPGASERDVKSVMFGDASCGRRYDGKVDDLMVYNRPLSPAEMKRIAGKKSVPPVKVDRLTAAKKLPQESMPQDGRVADFDFDGDEPEDRSGASAVVTMENKKLSGGCLVFDGHYDGDSKGEIYVPGLNFDHFTVAMSIRPQEYPKGFGQAFILGWCCGNAMKMMIKENVLEFRLANSGAIKIDVPLKLDDWNWFVLSVDAVGKKVRYAVNGKRGMPRSLSKDFAWAETGTDKPEARGFLFRDPGFGTRFKGLVDDFIVYDRALSAEEIVRIVNRRPASQAVKKPAKPAIGANQATETKIVGKTPVKPVPGAWTLKMGEVRSAYWNAVICREGKNLTVHRDGNELCVQPLGNVEGEADLTKPVMSEDGETFRIVGVGAARNFVGGRLVGGSAGKLKKVLLPESLTDLHESAFAGSLLEEIDLPKGLRKIGRSAFDGCVYLKSVTLPEGLESTGMHAFYRCTELTSLEIPESVTRIGDRSFMSCGKLTRLKIKGAPYLEEHAFGGFTPVGRKLPYRGGKVKPITVDVTPDPALAFAREGRMKDPFFNDLKFGLSCRFTGGCGSIQFQGHPEVAKRIDTSYHKVGPELISGVTVSWTVSEDSAGSCEKAKASFEAARKFAIGKFPKLAIRPIEWKGASAWPDALGELDQHYGREGLRWEAQNSGDYSRCVAESKTDEDGYRIEFHAWGAKNSKTVFLVMDIFDATMERAWGLER